MQIALYIKNSRLAVMRLKTILFTLFVFAVQSKAQHYDFTVTAPSGQTLYYDITGNSVRLVNPYCTEGMQGKGISIKPFV